MSATNFEQALTANGGVVDAVWAANDPNAAGVITILDKFGLTVPVSGQDATVAGLQNVLLGKQWGTVWKPYTLEAEAASDLAIALLKGESPRSTSSSMTARRTSPSPRSSSPRTTCKTSSTAATPARLISARATSQPICAEKGIG